MNPAGRYDIRRGEVISHDDLRDAYRLPTTLEGLIREMRAALGE